MTDLRIAARGLLRSPVFALMGLFALTSAIAANTTIFSVVNAVLFRPLPFRDPGRLFVLSRALPKQNLVDLPVSAATYLAWKDRLTAFEEIGAYFDTRLHISGEGRPERVSGARVTPEVFAALGRLPILGSLPGREQGDLPIVLLGEGLWERRFGGDPSVIGKKVLLEGRPFTVLGVMPRNFRFPEYAELWVPLAVDASRAMELRVLARLRYQASPEEAASELESTARELEKSGPRSGVGEKVSMTSLRRAYIGDSGTISIVLLAVVGAVFLVACSNIASLHLGRMMERRGELLTRLALGGGAGAIARLLLAESLILSLTAGILGTFLGIVAGRALISAIPVELPFWVDLSPDRRVFTFALVVTVVAALLSGTFPALRGSSGLQLNLALKEEGGGIVGGRRSRLWGMLVAAQVSITLVLLCCTGLLWRGYSETLRRNPGFRLMNGITARVEIGDTRRANDLSLSLEAILGRLSRIPGVASAVASSHLPLGGAALAKIRTGFGLCAGEPISSDLLVISPGYFKTFGIQVRNGREFSSVDGARAASVVIVNRKLAKTCFGEFNPVGQAIFVDDAKEPTSIVGVVDDVRQWGMNTPARSGIYRVSSQFPMASWFVTLSLREARKDLASAILRELEAVDPEVVVGDFQSLRRIIANSLWMPRLEAWLVCLFALVALTLSGSGIYGLATYSISQRKREIGLRIALGAGRGDVVRDMLRESFCWTIIGVVPGLLLAALAGKVLGAAIAGVPSFDGLVLVGAPLLVVALTFVATYPKARRAALQSPVEAIRAV